MTARLELAVPASPEVVVVVRAFAVAVLRGAGADDDAIESARVVASELATGWLRDHASAISVAAVLDDHAVTLSFRADGTRPDLLPSAATVVGEIGPGLLVERGDGWSMTWPVGGP